MSQGTAACVAIFRNGEFLQMSNGVVQSKLNIADIEEVYAFKEDQFSYDEVLLHVRFSGDVICEATESTSCFENITNKLESELPGMKKDWYKEVIFPAFERNHTVLWKRS